MLEHDRIVKKMNRSSPLSLCLSIRIFIHVLCQRYLALFIYNDIGFFKHPIYIYIYMCICVCVSVCVCVCGHKSKILMIKKRNNSLNSIVV